MTTIYGFARLGAKPTLKFLPGKTTSDTNSVAEVGLSMSNYRRRGEDDTEDKSFWVEAAIWGPLGELAARNFNKGDKVFVVGDLISDHWKNKETGEPQSKLVLRVDQLMPDLRSLESFRYKPRPQNNREQDSPESTFEDANGSPRALNDSAGADPTQDPDIPFSDDKGVHPVVPRDPETDPAKSNRRKRAAA